MELLEIYAAVDGLRAVAEKVSRSFHDHAVALRDADDKRALHGMLLRLHHVTRDLAMSIANTPKPTLKGGSQRSLGPASGYPFS